MLAQENFTVYAPKLRVRRTIRGRREDSENSPFPGYAFVLVRLQWHRARWCPGVMRLVMDGIAPAKVPDTVIEAIRKRVSLSQLLEAARTHEIRSRCVSAASLAEADCL